MDACTLSKKAQSETNVPSDPLPISPARLPLKLREVPVLVKFSNPTTIQKLPGLRGDSDPLRVMAKNKQQKFQKTKHHWQTFYHYKKTDQNMY